jgi:hypothetical protein
MLFHCYGELLYDREHLPFSAHQRESFIYRLTIGALAAKVFIMETKAKVNEKLIISPAK